MEINQNIAQEKKELRRAYIQKMAALSEDYRKHASEKILKELVKHKDYLLAGTIFIYVGTEHEVDTTLIIKDALAKGKKVVVPKTITLGQMEACEIDTMEDLHPGRHGILEPADTTLKVDPSMIDLALVPCVAYSEDGFRLGYGGGFYDRYLTRGSFRRILLAFSEMQTDHIPRDAFDEKVHGILTEKGYNKI